jgi:hypothetical protein
MGDEIFSSVKNLSRKIISPDNKLFSNENFFKIYLYF